MTVNAMQGDREKTLEAGMDDYVSKPVKSEELDEVLKRWILRETPEPEAPILNLDNGSTKEERAGSPLNYKVIESLRELQVEGEPDTLPRL